jgi:hypothetical protein
MVEHVEQKSSGPVTHFSLSFFRHAPNLKTQAFIDLVARFGPTYKADFELFLDKSRSDALTDLLEVRNDIAHGKYQSGRKLDPERYIRLCEEIYDWLIAKFLGSSVEVIGLDGYERIGVETAAASVGLEEGSSILDS